jgi:orotate phosphoribosyltransferase
MLAALPTKCGVSTQRSTRYVDVKATTPKEQLLEILKEKSVCHGSFTLASGVQSDLYIDAKQTTQDPRGAILVGRVGWEVVKQVARGLRRRVDSIGGLTMGADPIALSIGISAHLEDPSSELQTFVVRKEAKTHGRQKLIEGDFSPGDSVVIVDDVITTGGSTLQAIEAVKGAEGKIAFVIVLVDRQQGGCENIEKHGYRVVPIFTREDLIGVHAPRRSDIAVA